LRTDCARNFLARKIYALLRPDHAVLALHTRRDMESRALALMERFAVRTGVTGEHAPRRYLWTDAFATCNFLTLKPPGLALRLVDQVHHQLGRHRPDDVRRGWISGTSEADGEAHDVMLATSLAPRGFLLLAPRDSMLAAVP
jgi:hypothetical protein